QQARCKMRRGLRSPQASPPPGSARYATGVMVHPDTALLRAYLDGRLSAGEAVRLEHHVAACAACRLALDRARAPARGEGHVLASRVSPRRRTAALALACGAALVIAVAVGAYVRTRAQRAPRAGPAAPQAPAPAAVPAPAPDGGPAACGTRQGRRAAARIGRRRAGRPTPVPAPPTPRLANRRSRRRAGPVAGKLLRRSRPPPRPAATRGPRPADPPPRPPARRRYARGGGTDPRLGHRAAALRAPPRGRARLRRRPRGGGPARGHRGRSPRRLPRPPPR